MANFSKTRPDIPDDWVGNMADTCKVLGNGNKPISKGTLMKYAALGRRYGGIDWKPGKRGKLFIGREIKRFWATVI